MRRRVIMSVDAGFFKIFDAQRRRTQEKLGMRNLTQTQFTEMLGKNGSIFNTKIIRRPNVKRKTRTSN